MIFWLLQSTSYYLNSTITNSTNIATTLQFLNNSPAFGGYLGLAISLLVFALFTLSFSFRVKIVHAVLAAALIGLMVSIIGVWLSITSEGVVMLFIGIAIVAGILSFLEGVLRPFD